jgi:transposase
LPELEQIRESLVQRPDITLSELIDQFGFVLSVSALSRIVRFKLGFRFKKNATPCRTTTPGCQNQAGGMEVGTVKNAR